MFISNKSPANLLLTAAAVIIVLAGVRAASTITIPLLVAVFIATIASSLLVWLERRGSPGWLALVLVILAVTATMSSIWWVISNSFRAFNQRLPYYQLDIGLLLNQGIQELQAFSSEMLGVHLPDNFFSNWLDPNQLVQLFGVALGGIGSVLSNSFLILIAVIFILLEVSSFPRKLRAVLRSPEVSMRRFNHFASAINHYLAIKTIISLITGLLAALLCLLVGIDFPLLWGLVAFLLNYIPTFGSLIAGIPPILLAAIQIDLTWASILAFGYLVINNVLGGVIEPRLLGNGLGISPLVVLLSLFFWGWMLGPAGLLLAVPLTTALKIALESDPDTRWFAVLLGSGRDLAEHNRILPALVDASKNRL